MVIHDVYPTLQRLKYVEVGIAFTVRSVQASTDETVANITSELIGCINLGGNQMFPDLFFFKDWVQNASKFYENERFLPWAYRRSDSD